MDLSSRFQTMICLLVAAQTQYRVGEKATSLMGSSHVSEYKLLPPSMSHIVMERSLEAEAQSEPSGETSSDVMASEWPPLRVYLHEKSSRDQTLTTLSKPPETKMPADALGEKRTQ